MKKYNNTKTVIVVSNKSAILVYVVAALMISTAAIYFLAASQDYSDLLSTSSSSNNDTKSKDEGDTLATVNEMIFFIVVGIAYIAAGIWMVENKYYSKVPYVLAAIGSVVLIAFYISTRTINIPSIQGDVGTIDILSKVLQAATAGISIYIVKSSTIVWRSAITRASSPHLSPAEILEHEVRKIRNINES